MPLNLFIAQTVDGSGYLIFNGKLIVGGPYNSAAEADRARAKLIKQAKGKAISTKG